jgi:hypothetical protein
MDGNTGNVHQRVLGPSRVIHGSWTVQLDLMDHKKMPEMEHVEEL